MFLHRYEKAKSDAKTELFHRYLEFLFQTQLKERMKTIWMREGDLDEFLPDEPFKEETLRSLLKSHQSVPEEATNIFILQGDTGDGRKFYLKKMMEVCYEEIHHIGWKQAQEQDVEFRFPILAVREVVSLAESERGPLDLIEFALQCIIRQLNLEEWEQKTARALLEGLGQMGKLAVFFNEGMCKDTNILINRLNSSKKQVYQPIAVFIESSQFSLNGDGKYYCIRLKPLKIQQIVRYLSAELPRLYGTREAENMLRDHAEVANILSKPERLLIHISGVEGDAELKDASEITITKIYETFVLKQIDQAYSLQGEQEGAEKIRKQLTEWLICRARGKEFSDAEVGQQCQQCFANSEILNRDLDDFRFEGCKYYLIAHDYFTRGNLGNNIRKKIKRILLSEHPMVLKFFAGLCVGKIRHPETFFKQMVALLKDPKENEARKAYKAPAKFLADILTFTGRVDRDGVEFVKWAGEEMWKDVYDTSVLEALASLNKQNAAILSKLEERYAETENAREKRRIAYCFGYMGPGVLSEQMISDFCKTCSAPMDKETRHLQYHVSTTLIDCCKQNDDLYSLLGQMEDALGKHLDPILRSDFDTLYTQINNRHYQSTREEQKQCENELINLLENGTYFEMAHAAGALGRRNYDGDEWGIKSVIERLLSVLDKIMTDMSNVESVNFNALKTVSYIVESCCKLAERNGCCGSEVRDGLRQQLEPHIEVLVSVDVPILVYQCLESALKLIVTGLIWLLEPKTEVRMELGLCFASRTTILQTVSELIQRDKATYEEGLKGKIQALEELSNAAKVEETLRSKFQYQPQCGRELDFSLAYLKYKEERMMAGFFFCYQNNIYFITCRHCFFIEENVEKLRIPLENINQVTFSLACLDNTKQYHGILCYPENVLEPNIFEQNATNDLVVYQLTDVPVGFTQVVFSEQCTLILTGSDGMENHLKAFGFLEWGRIPGRFIYGHRYSAASHDLFSLEADQNQPLGNNANWFSGVPIIKGDNDIRIVGMWKASDSKESRIFGITMAAIINELEKFQRKRMACT